MRGTLLLAPALLLMIGGIAAAEAPRPAFTVGDIEHAIKAGRLMQARIMADQAARTALAGRALDRSVAALTLAEGNAVAALAGFRLLLLGDGDDAEALEGAGLSAARIGDPAAEEYLRHAVARDAGRWRAWNALAVLQDRRGEWQASGQSYAKALALAGEEPAILSNQGYSLILQRRFAEALPLLSRAHARAPADRQISNNLLLAEQLTGRKAAVAGDDETRAIALNNAGYAAWLRGEMDVARALLIEAMQISPSFYARAANNLSLVEQDKR